VEIYAQETGPIRLGIAFTSLTAGGFLGFIALGAFFPNMLAARVLPSHAMSVGLAYGLGLITAAVMTTLAYAWRANQQRGGACGRRAR
jgi:uncharacterized membrane protein (DUF485 family)